MVPQRREWRVTQSPNTEKALRILVVNPPLEIESDFIDYPYYVNLGALHVGAVLRAQGWDVDIADAFAQRDSGVCAGSCGRIVMGCTSPALLEPIADKCYDAVVLCLSVFHRPFQHHAFTAKFVEQARAAFPGALLVAADAYFGGMHYVDYEPASFFTHYPQCDALVRYEAELALADFIRTAQKHAHVAVDGRGTGMRLDDLPFPAWDLIDAETYLAFLDRVFKATGRARDFLPAGRCLPLVTSRGCIYKCSFCSPPVSRDISPYRSYSREYMSRYLRELKAAYRLDGVAVLDGIANAHPERFAKLLDDLERQGLSVSFVNGLRADRLTREHIVRLAGLTPGVAVSAESACARVRNEILDKKLDLKAVEQVAAWCREQNVPSQIHYMVGAPGETVEEVNVTLAHAAAMAREHGATPLMQFCVPIPGAPLWEQCRRLGIALPDFSGAYYDFFHTNPCVDTPALPASEVRALKARLDMRLRENNPDKLIINLTYRCNNKCAMCAVGGRPKEDMDRRDVLNLLKDYRLRGVLMVDFDGGEPTLHPDLLELIGTARRMGYQRVAVTTNGRKMADRGFASRLLLSGITDLLISLYGADAHTHEKATCATGSFQQTVQGIRHALELKPERITFGINTVVTATNYTRLHALTGFVAELGVDRITVQYPTPFGRAVQEHVPPFEETSRILAGVTEEFQGRVAVQVINLPPCKLPGGEAQALADAGKFGRVMAFVNEAPQNLGVFLSQNRRHTKICAACPYLILCEGEYVFEDC
jgi:MoaA/NifB/PqqE/SkfB family radical SAM enzyme